MSAEERAQKVARFQSPLNQHQPPGDKTYKKRFDVMVCSTQTGGVGLTLTKADRVILIDPSWNPAIDEQAVDRAYRVGQTRDVIAYRLILHGMIEEKMFRYQVFKKSLDRAVL